MEMKNKKGISIEQMGGLALAFVLVAIIVGIGATIVTEIQSGQCTGGSSGWNATLGACTVTGGLSNLSTIASNISSEGLSGLETMGEWLPTIAVIISAAVVIGVIVKYFQG